MKFVIHPVQNRYPFLEEKMKRKKRAITLAIIALSSVSSTLAASEWEHNQAYNAGDVVTHLGHTYISAHWNLGNAPEKNEDVWDGWIYLDNSNIPLYQSESSYNGGAVVSYQGHYFLSKWWTKGEYPDNSNAWRLLKNYTVWPSTPKTPVKPPSDPKSAEAILGIDSDSDGIRDSYINAVVEQYQKAELVQLALSAGHEYKVLHELALEVPVSLSPQEAKRKLHSIVALEDCVEHLKNTGQITVTPDSLYNETIYQSLYYRIGKRRLFEAMGANYDELPVETQACPKNLKVGGQQ